MPEQRFTIISDEDCHWYVCPVDKLGDAQKAFNYIAKIYGDPDYDEDAPEVPDYCKPIGGALTLLSFTDPQIK